MQGGCLAAPGDGQARPVEAVAGAPPILVLPPQFGGDPGCLRRFDGARQVRPGQAQPLAAEPPLGRRIPGGVSLASLWERDLTTWDPRVILTGPIMDNKKEIFLWQKEGR
jgi:hypothetical protein